MSCKLINSYIKISSLGLMIKHEQFNLNHSTKHIFSQKYIFKNTVFGIVKPSVTIPKKLQFIDSLCEPGFHGHFRPFAYQTYILMHNLSQIAPKQPILLHGLPKNALIFHTSVLSFGTYQLAPLGLIQLNT